MHEAPVLFLSQFLLQFLGVYSAFCTVVVFTCNLALFFVPGVAFFIMNTLVGVNVEIANLSLTPFKIFSLLCLNGKLGHKNCRMANGWILYNVGSGLGHQRKVTCSCLLSYMQLVSPTIYLRSSNEIKY